MNILLDSIIWFTGLFIGAIFYASGLEVNPYTAITALNKEMSTIEVILAFTQALAPVAAAFVTGYFIYITKRKK